MKPDLLAVYQTLKNYFGHRRWWPGGSKFEIILGAILTQNTNWNNVQKAITNLKQANALSFKRIAEMPQEQVAQYIRPSGYYNQKAMKIKAFVEFVQREYQGNLSKMFREETGALREKLLQVKGIGRETADSILLYAGGHLIFVIDLYTYRILTRHGWLAPDTDYDEMQSFFESRLPADVELYNDYHAQLVAAGSRYCRKTPNCEQCPLREFLPNGQPLEV